MIVGVTMQRRTFGLGHRVGQVGVGLVDDQRGGHVSA